MTDLSKPGRNVHISFPEASKIRPVNNIHRPDLKFKLSQIKHGTFL